ncbi:MAG: lytic transglycosylase domain-containing protein [Parasphingorhabdus sp.]|uniref:lytic transglycosylase domain-containing protein n=1 Tax=Parasphingorhabdus sp. TaxID=2709688 RepID=UPI003002301B
MSVLLSSITIGSFVFGVLQPTSLQAQTIPVAPAKAVSKQAGLQEIIREASVRFAIPERWIVEVIRAESNGKVGAVSHKGARGLMQIMPATWGVLRRRYNLKNAPYAPRENIMAGTAYLREMYNKFGYPGCLAAYNAGPGRYSAWVSGKRKLPLETINYVNKITSRIGRGSSFAAANSSSIAKPNAVRPAQSGLFISRPVADGKQENISALGAKGAHPKDDLLQGQGLFVPVSGASAPE